MLKLLSNIQSEMFVPADSVTEGGSTIKGDMSKEDIIDFLGDDTEEKETIPLDDKKKDDKPREGQTTTEETDDTEEGTEESEETPEIDELAELEAELETPSDEDLELVTPVRRSEILKAYPDIFKKFPYLERAYYREQQYTELLPTIDDAKEAVGKSKVLDNFERDLMQGNSENILLAVQKSNPEAFNRIVDNYMVNLQKVDKNAYFHVVGNLTKNTVYAMVQEARRTNNEQLQQAAHLLNMFVFGTSEWKPPSNLAREEKSEDNSREKQLNQERQAFVTRQFESTRDNLNSRVNNALRNTIEANIDPRESMSDYVRKNASRDAMDSLEGLINRDSRFKTIVDKLWEAAFKDNFSQASVDRIKSAYVSKAKTLLPAVIKQARNEALRGMGKRVRDDSSESEKDKKGPVSGGRPRSQTSGKITNPKDIPRGMSTLDFLNSD